MNKPEIRFHGDEMQFRNQIYDWAPVLGLSGNGGGIGRGSQVDAALAEFYQARRDKELGRWRWPENPDYVVYPKVELQARGNARGVTVLTERIPRTYTVWEDNVAILYGTSSDEVARQGARESARAYFEAHPEPKSWDAAQEGEAWVLELKNGQTHPAIFQADMFRDTGGAWSSAEIKSARRIWPEGDK